ncbi:hypothetical protein AXG93_3241s1090 [Marchantia polymorpha subsp. ruderalis]|uniref:Uncharacterized protein n=1 Tax=Marchantia polymorpha subsp. ruderalis TaxID=1480154 RepID=A0A176W9M7_MARPO|nr:hypothetical protein AXG93_3241s1090 [Marchantia polymorpha subsp. ruderalis]
MPSVVVPSAEGATELSSTEPDWEYLAASTVVSSPTPLEMLAGQGVEAAAEEAVRPSARESPRISAATEILESEDDTPSEEEEVQSVRGTPTGVLCEQVVPLLRPEVPELEEALQLSARSMALARKLQKAALKLRDEMVANARRKIDELRAKVQTDSSVEHIQIRNMADELVRKT